jgi:hypothetical protein
MASLSLTQARITTRLAGAAVAGLLPVAELAVIAVAVVVTLDADIIALIAVQTRTRIATRLAVQRRIAGFGAVAVQAVIAVAVVRNVVARGRDFVARIDRTVHPIVAIDGRSRLACAAVAGFLPVAELAVIAVAVVVTLDADIVALIAVQARTRVTARLTASVNAGLLPVAD